MARILVIHRGVMTKGGGEAVCLNVLEALQADHDVTLLTTGQPSLAELNEYFGTAVSDVQVDTNSALTLSDTIPFDLAKLKSALFSRACQQTITGRYDVVINTRNETFQPMPATGSDRFIKYIHYPEDVETDRKLHSAMQRLVVAPYNRLCDAIAPEPGRVEAIELLANSKWTAQLVDERVGADSQVLYPPVYTDDIDPVPWQDRTETILTIGRLETNKNILEMIKVVRSLRERGHEIEFRIVGPDPPGRSLPLSDSYADTVRKRADTLDFVHFEGAVTRDRLTELLASTKYGLHGMEVEHFGIAVAELVAGGAIPFVPRNGCQQEVVDFTEEVLYETTAEAVDKMDRLLRDTELQQRVRSKLPDIKARFGRERFQDEIRAVIESTQG